MSGSKKGRCQRFQSGGPVGDGTTWWWIMDGRGPMAKRIKVNGSYKQAEIVRLLNRGASNIAVSGGSTASGETYTGRASSQSELTTKGK